VRQLSSLPFPPDGLSICTFDSLVRAETFEFPSTLPQHQADARRPLLALLGEYIRDESQLANSCELSGRLKCGGKCDVPYRRTGSVRLTPSAIACISVSLSISHRVSGGLGLVGICSIVVVVSAGRLSIMLYQRVACYMCL